MNTSLNRDPDASKPRPMPVPVPVRNPLALALFWASKTDARLVSVCSRWARATQAAFGVFVVFTAILAFGAVYCALTTLSVPGAVVPWIAFGWSTFIFFLDREIAGSLDKTTAVVRPFLALFIGALIAIPLEIFIFGPRIDQEIQREYRQDNSRQLAELHANEAKLEQRRAEMEGQLAELRKQDATWAAIQDAELAGRAGAGRTGLRGAGPVFENAQAQQTAIRQRIQEVRNDLDHWDRNLPEARDRLAVQFRSESVGKVTDFVTRYEAMDRVIHSSDPLYRLSWLITLALILIEMTPAILKILTPHVDYHHLVRAEIRENVARIDEISERNYRLAMENPEVPRLSVAEKFTIVRYTPIDNVTSFGKRYATKDETRNSGAGTASA